jgi:hypothetical protein
VGRNSRTGKTIWQAGYKGGTCAPLGYESVALIRLRAGEETLGLLQLNGRDLAHLIAEMKPGLKILFMSGYTADVIAHQGILEEGVSFVSKPFSMNWPKRSAKY